MALRGQVAAPNWLSEVRWQPLIGSQRSSGSPWLTFRGQVAAPDWLLTSQAGRQVGTVKVELSPHVMVCEVRYDELLTNDDPSAVHSTSI